MSLVDPVTLELVTKALDAAGLRQAVLAQNIANANVAGYKPARVSFEDQLAQVRGALNRGESVSSAELANVGAIVQPDDTAGDVELDSQVAAMSQNALQYQALLKAIDSELGLVSLAVSDGKR
jgi:flagellar basal-body rod protein FlgB